MVEIKRKITIKRKGEPPPATDGDKKKNKWWLWLIPIFLIGGIVGFFLMKDYRETGNSADAPQTGINNEVKAAVADNTAEPETTKVVAAAGDDKEAKPSASETTMPQAETKPVQGGTAKPAQSTTATSSQTQGSVEERARKAIRGDFGNGAARKQALGGDYAAIQRKVNEIYRTGDF